MLAEDIAWTRTISGRSPGTKTTFTVQDFQNGLLGNATGTISISEWISKRASSVAQQLNFNDTDDLPALPAYTQGSRLDANGNVVNSNGQVTSSNGNGTVTPGGNNADGSKSAAVSTKSTIAFTMSAMVVAGFALAL
jgi:hypothetical protein